MVQFSLPQFMLMLLLIVTNIVLVTHEGEFARINRALHSQLSRQRIPVVSGLLLLLSHATDVMFSAAFPCLSITRITEKPLNRFSQNSVERWHMGQGIKD